MINAEKQRDGWRTVKLGEVCGLAEDAYSQRDKWSFVNYIDTGSVTRGIIESFQRITIGVDELPSRARRKVNCGDVLYSTVRPNQCHYCFLKTLPQNPLASTGFAVLRSNKDYLDNLYLYYYLSQEVITNHLHAIGEQSCCAYPSIRPSDLLDLDISLPPLPIQRRIAGVLGALDDKIELNRKMNANLEAQAQALYKSWFVDFEPWGGKMPSGWKNCLLGEVSVNVRDRVGDEERVVLSAVTTGNLVLSDEYFVKQVFSADISKYIIVEANDFAYNPSRINIGSIGINDLGVKGCVSPIYVCVRFADEYENFFRFFVKSKQFHEEVKMRSIGSVRQTLNYSDFALIKCCYPTIEAIRRFNGIYNKIYSLQTNNSRESRKLAELRDAMLPKLMSGELEVAE